MEQSDIGTFRKKIAADLLDQCHGKKNMPKTSTGISRVNLTKCNEYRKMATKAAAFSSFGALSGNVDFDRKATLRDQVDATREFVASNVIW